MDTGWADWVVKYRLYLVAILTIPKTCQNCLQHSGWFIEKINIFCLPNKGPCQDTAAPLCLALASLQEQDGEEGNCHCDMLVMEWLACSAAPCWEGRRQSPWASCVGHYLAAALFSQKSQDFFQALEQLADEVPNKEGIFWNTLELLLQIPLCSAAFPRFFPWTLSCSCTGWEQ